ncbi:putative receptor-type adenylate cyclase [Trypanosoma cruzi]|uniref:Putative receptor-type adenylate cyclase n=1 Tax=Trypanosoma cruzi TaxID=5693 RepID=A0A2V2WBN8_TRYCR|nr:putative receptor-type adenylate cyclase [Trypanosoma cruzi]
MLQDYFLRAWHGAMAGGVEFVPGQVITTGTSPLAKDTQYEAIQRFQNVMQDYLAHSGQKDYVDKDHFLKDDGDGAMMVAGWIAGEVLSQALGNREWVKNRTSFLTSLYNQRRYVVDDIVIGDYGGECKSEAASQGATCRCNQGGRIVQINRVMGAHRLKPFKDVMRFHLSNCNVSYVKIPPVFIGLYFLMDDNAFAFTACLQFDVVFAAASFRHEKWWEQGAVFAYPLRSTTYDSAGDLRSELQSRRAYAVLGVVTDAMLDVEGVTFIDPLLLEPRLNRFREKRDSPVADTGAAVLCDCEVPWGNEWRLRARSDPQRGGCSNGGFTAAVAGDVWRVAGIRNAAGWRRRACGPPAGGGRRVFWWAFLPTMLVRSRSTWRQTTVCVCLSCSRSLRCCTLSLLLRSTTVRVRTVLFLRRACRTGTTKTQRRRPPRSLPLLCRRKNGRRCH